MVIDMPELQNQMLTQQTIQPAPNDAEAAMSELLQDLIAQGYSEDEIAQIMQLTQYQAQEQALNNQIQQATAQAQTGAPPGLQGPQLYTAASPLEHIANTIQAYRGTEALPQLRNQQQGLMDERTNALMMLLRGQ